MRRNNTIAPRPEAAVIVPVRARRRRFSAGDSRNFSICGNTSSATRFRSCVLSTSRILSATARPICSRAVTIRPQPESIELNHWFILTRANNSQILTPVPHTFDRISSSIYKRHSVLQWYVLAPSLDWYGPFCRHTAPHPPRGCGVHGATRIILFFWVSEKR